MICTVTRMLGAVSLFAGRLSSPSASLDTRDSPLESKRLCTLSPPDRNIMALKDCRTWGISHSSVNSRHLLPARYILTYFLEVRYLVIRSHWEVLSHCRLTLLGRYPWMMFSSADLISEIQILDCWEAGDFWLPVVDVHIESSNTNLRHAEGKRKQTSTYDL